MQLRDNGVGFDSSLPKPEGHFGMTMMRERAKIGGGFEVFSVPGQGTTITVRFPTSLLQQEPSPGPSGSEPGDGTTPEHAPGTSGIGEPAAESSRGTVHV